MREQAIRFDRLRAGDEFMVPYSTLTGIKRGKHKAAMYNDADEFVGWQPYKAWEMVLVWD